MFGTIKKYLKKVTGNSIIEDLRPYENTLSKILTLSKELGDCHDIELKRRVKGIKLNCKEKPTDELLIEVYALVVEGFKRRLGICPFETQIMGAIVLNDNKIIEMQTGEGKTLVAVFSACLNAISNRGVHVLTFNDYLAKRDAQWMQPVYDFMELTVGCIQEANTSEERRLAYRCHVTYATGKEVGFDYLRSCMIYDLSENIMRDFNYVIVDEADAIMIDEARNPLVFAGSLETSQIDLSSVASFVGGLVQDEHYVLDEYARNVFLTEIGIKATEVAFDIVNLYDHNNIDFLSAVNLALQAKALLHKDIDYVVRDGTIKIVDEFTGRIVENRKWQNGLQTAIEAKERLSIQSEGRILNNITIPDLLRHYKKISGMTGTAKHAREEFHNIYGLDVAAIPTRNPSIRIDHPDKIFTHRDAKMRAIVEEVKEISFSSRPILIGTRSIKESEELEFLLREHGVSCITLNAKNDEIESAIIENAGLPGSVTISTNMAGRGSDIKLGGRDSKNKGSIKEKLAALGGLHVIGTNRHESVRIDNQLKGRAGRQGDPGSTQFIIGMDDDLMVRYGLKTLLPKSLRSVVQEYPLKSKILNQKIAQAQRIIEGQLFEIRQSLYHYSHFVEKQRSIFFGRRNELLTYPNPELNKDQIQYALYQYDLLWSDYLVEISSLKQNIYWERLAGKEPVREFYKKADLLFKQLLKHLETEINIPDAESMKNIKVKRPASTLTYLVNDNPFGNQLAIRLLQLGAYRF